MNQSIELSPGDLIVVNLSVDTSCYLQENYDVFNLKPEALEVATKEYLDAFQPEATPEERSLVVFNMHRWMEINKLR